MDGSVKAEHENRLVLGEVCRILCGYLQPAGFLLITVFLAGTLSLDFAYARSFSKMRGLKLS